MHSVNTLYKASSTEDAFVFGDDTVRFMRYPGRSHRRHQRRLTGDLSHALSQHLYEARNAADGFQGTTPCNSCGTWETATDGISNGLKGI